MRALNFNPSYNSNSHKVGRLGRSLKLGHLGHEVGHLGREVGHVITPRAHAQQGVKRNGCV